MALGVARVKTGVIGCRKRAVRSRRAFVREAANCTTGAAVIRSLYCVSLHHTYMYIQHVYVYTYIRKLTSEAAAAPQWHVSCEDTGITKEDIGTGVVLKRKWGGRL